MADNNFLDNFCECETGRMIIVGHTESLLAKSKSALKEIKQVR